MIIYYSELGAVVISGRTALVDDSYVLAIPRNYGLNTLIKLLRFASSSRGWLKVLVNLKTSVITLVVNNVRRTAVVPPLSLFISCGECDDVISRLENSDITTYNVGDNSWVECKEIPSTVFVFADRSPPILQQLNLDILKLNSVSEIRDVFGCILISCDDCLDVSDFDNLMSKVRYVMDLRSIRGLSKVKVGGSLKYYLKDHILLYGIGLKEFHGLIADVQGFKRVLTYGKPLIHVNSKYLVMEMPNNSIVFSGGLDLLDELLIRALIYSC